MTDVRRQPIDSMNDDFKLFPVLRVILSNIGGSVQNFGEQMEMPRTLLANRAIPMIVVTERAGAPALRTFPMKPGEAMVTLDSIRNDAWGRRPNGRVADASVEFVIGRRVVFRAGVLDNVCQELFTMGLVMLRAEPRQRRDPGLMLADL